MVNHGYTQAQEDFIRENYLTMTYAELSRKLGKGDNTIRSKAIQLNCIRKPIVHKKINHKQVLKLISEGYTVSEVANSLNCSKGGVRLILHNNGIEPPYPSKHPPTLSGREGEKVFEVFCKQNNLTFKKYPFAHTYDYRVGDIDINVKYTKFDPIASTSAHISTRNITKMKNGDEFWFFIGDTNKLFKLSLTIVDF